MKKLLVLVGALVVLLLAAFFVVTSSAFLKAVVLPRVGTALNARVEAENIALSPFSSVEIRKLSVTPNGAEPLATVDLARVRYRLSALLGGNVALEEVFLGSPAVTLVRKADGTSNLDPILKKLAEGGSTPPPKPGEPAKPPTIDIKAVTIQNATLGYRAEEKDGSRTTAEVKGLTLGIRDVRNGGEGAVDVQAGLGFTQTPAAGKGEPSRLQADLRGNFKLALTAELAPASVTGKAEASVKETAGAFKELQGLATVLTADLAPTELKRLALEFQRQGTALGSISAKGPFDAARSEAKLQLEVASIDRNVLNLFGAAQGLDFTTTRFDSTNQIELSAGGKALAVSGQVTGTAVSVKKGDLTMPPVDLRKTYDVAVDLAGEVATVKAFALTGRQGGREVVRGSLSKPMQIRWGAAAQTVPDAAIDLALTDLRLADWSALAGVPLQGSVSAQANVGVRGGGKDLGFSLTSGLTGFTGTFGSNAVRNLGLKATLEGAVAAFADAAQRRLTATAVVQDLAGGAGPLTFAGYGIDAKADLGLPEGAVAINALDLQVRNGGREGGRLSTQGRWDTTRGAGELRLQAVDVNETGLKPFLQAALGDKELRSVRLSAEVTTRIDPQADSSVQATAAVTNLVVRDPSGTVPESALAAGFSLDASGKGQKLTIRKAGLELTPTPRAKNVATLSGDLDFSKADALQGALKFASESFDITPWFDLFAGAPKPSPAPTPPPSSGPMQEPEAIHLPIELLTLDATVGKFFLREVAAENFVAAVKITGSRIEVQPLQLTLNGAPIKAGLKLNVGVPGYEYDFNLSAEGVPVRPFANSFVPSLKDRIGGAIRAGADVRGAGVTGINLQKHLQGGMSFVVTNANLSLNPTGNQKPGVLTLLTRLLATALNIQELKDRPIMDIVATSKMGGGQIELTEARARSASVEVNTQGAIPIAADLMQSPLAFPVNVALARDLAQRARLMPADAPTNAVYVPLPALASLKGTLGAPAPEVDKVKAGLLVARGISGLVGGQTGATAGGVVDLVTGVAEGKSNAVPNLITGIGSLLGGGKAPAAATNTAGATNTNAPATNAAPADPVGSLLKGLLGPKKQP